MKLLKDVYGRRPAPDCFGPWDYEPRPIYVADAKNIVPRQQDDAAKINPNRDGQDSK